MLFCRENSSVQLVCLGRVEDVGHHWKECGTLPNRLATETSPYLLQHAQNPVDWWPWGPEAFAEAERLDQPILLSIGYAACHW